MQNSVPFLTVKDYSVSGESFNLIYNESLDLLETSPKPSDNNLSAYYKSEDYISHTDSKRNLFESVYHVVRSIALNRKLKLINSFASKGKSLLDVGCGTGDFLKTAQSSGWNVTGVEPNDSARTIANQKTTNAVFDVAHLDTLSKSQFDVITLWHVLEHLPDLDQQLEKFKTLLKPNGVLVIAVPNYKSYDAVYYKEYWAAFDVPRHLWHFSQTSIKRLGEKFQFNLEKVLPMKFDAYYVSLLSEKHKSGKMNVISGFFRGWLSNLKAMSSSEYSSLIYVLKKNE
ncbi:MAG: methyltransferase [Bacteroidetes bacterium MedPE-SWsnd-G2]|nr:MAG: methyltransferase [Bacteroidetes bacterium MedPE-SWsnd-G2]